MPSKKAVRKVVVKKVGKSTKKATVTRPRAVSTVTVSELFTTRETAEPIVQVPANSVALFINGRSEGTVDTRGAKLKDFVVQHAQRKGITSFSVYVDGVKADTSVGANAMTGISKVELVSKDSRG